MHRDQRALPLLSALLALFCGWLAEAAAPTPSQGHLEQVGMLLLRNSIGGVRPLCVATLLEPDVAVTAASCFPRPKQLREGSLFFVAAPALAPLNEQTTYPVRAIDLHVDFRKKQSPLQPLYLRPGTTGAERKARRELEAACGQQDLVFPPDWLRCVADLPGELQERLDVFGQHGLLHDLAVVYLEPGRDQGLDGPPARVPFRRPEALGETTMALGLETMASMPMEGAPVELVTYSGLSGEKRQSNALALWLRDMVPRPERAVRIPNLQTARDVFSHQFAFQCAGCSQQAIGSPLFAARPGTSRLLLVGLYVGSSQKAAPHEDDFVLAVRLSPHVPWLVERLAAACEPDAAGAVLRSPAGCATDGMPFSARVEMAE